MLLLWIASWFPVVVSGFFHPYPRGQSVSGGKHVGQKVIITPFVESGKLEEVRNLTFVPPLKGSVHSYAGYATVDKECDSNLFFWFFPAEESTPDTPVSVWLQGGPGASSIYGLLLEHGPYQLHLGGKLSLRKYSWTKVSSYLYIDNPVGTGYSYAKSEDCYSKNEEEVGRNLLSAIKQILRVFPKLQSNPFFVTGESYAGKYVPALAQAIHKDEDPRQKINLQGIAIGNGLVDPFNQLIYSEYLYQLGLVDLEGRSHLKKEEDSCRKSISDGNWAAAFDCFDNLLNGDTTPSKTFFQNATGFDTYFNFLYPKGEPEGNLTHFITQNAIRKRIHVGNSTWNDGRSVENHLKEDVMKSVRPWLEQLLENYRVLIYNGQLDIIVAYPLTEAYLQKLNWSAAEEYKTAKRHIWRVDQEVAGYVKTAGKLTEVLVRNAGHMVPKDQPKWALDLISRFFAGKSFY